MPATEDRLDDSRWFEVPWGDAQATADAAASTGGQGHAIVAVDTHGRFAALAYRQNELGLRLPELDLLAPFGATPVMRGVPRTSPGPTLAESRAARHRVAGRIGLRRSRRTARGRAIHARSRAGRVVVDPSRLADASRHDATLRDLVAVTLGVGDEADLVDRAQVARRQLQGDVTTELRNPEAAALNVDVLPARSLDVRVGRRCAREACADRVISLRAMRGRGP